MYLREAYASLSRSEADYDYWDRPPCRYEIHQRFNRGDDPHLEAEQIPPVSSRRAVNLRDEEFFNRYTCRGKRYIRPPNSLTYSGESDWTEFKLKYEQFCQDQNFMDYDSKDYLCWVLTGRAAEFYAQVLRQFSQFQYREIMELLEMRFGHRQLPQTTNVNFQYSCRPEPSLRGKDFTVRNVRPHCGSNFTMERDYDRRENPPDWPRFRYEPPRHHSPENEGEDHRGYTAHDYYRDGHRNGYLADHYARDEYRLGYSTVPHSINGYRRRYSPIPHTRDEYRGSQSPTRDRHSFQSQNSADRNGRSKPFEGEVMHLLRKMDTRLDDLTTRVERIEAGRRSPSPRRNASDLRCQGCGMSEEIEVSRPVPPDTKPVTEAPTPAQIQEQYGARSEKDEVCEAPITKEEQSHKGCDVVYKNHLGKVISIQQNDLDLSQAAALNGTGWSKVIKCNESPSEKIPWNGLDPPSTVMLINVPVSLHGKNIPWNGLDPPKTAGDSALGRSVRTTFCGGLESPMACHFGSFDSDTQKVNWNGLDPPRVALALDWRQLQFC